MFQIAKISITSIHLTYLYIFSDTTDHEILTADETS